MSDPGQPQFHKLVDWVEGRLDQDESAEIARLVAISAADEKATVNWIRNFIAAGRSMPMATPPPELHNELEMAFLRRIAPWRPSQYLDASLDFDSNNYGATSGMRSTEAPTSNHLIFDAGPVRLALDIVHPRHGLCDIQGVVLWANPEDNADRTELLFASSQSILHSTRCASDGAFQLEGLSSGVDEIWIVRGGHHIRAELPVHVLR